MRKFVLIVLLAVMCSAFPLLAAPIPAITLDNLTGQQLDNGPYTLGWEFTVNQNITVTALGVIDLNNQNGLLESHQVGIWDSNGFLKGQATVLALDPLTNQFRYATSTFVLTPGLYEIGATWNSLLDPLIFPGFAVNFATAPPITFTQNSYIAGGFADPTNHVDTEPAYFGPNFLYTTSSIPEPGTLALLGSGLLGAVGVLRRKLNV
jgi:hypothetical protein